MKRIAGLLTVLVVVGAAPARAQLVVIDPGNLAQAILIAERTLSEYNTLLAQYETIVRMAQSLGAMDRYRTQPIALTGNDHLQVR